MNQFMGVMTDPFIAGRGGAAGAGATPFAEESIAEPMLRRTGRAPKRARRLCRDLPQGAACRDRFDAALERVGGRLWRLADHRRQRRARIEQQQPAACSASPPAPTTASRRIPWPALRWPAAAPISASPMAAAAAPTCSRPAPSSATMSARPISPARWPMAGRTSPPTAP